MSKAYVVGHVTVKNETKWAEYRSKIPATLEPWCAELVFRGKLSSVLSGDHSHSDAVVICFPGNDALNGWYQSEAYRDIIPIRQEAADMELLTYEAS